MTVAPIQVTGAEWDEILNHEAVVIREWECKDGTRFAEILHWGEWEECRDIASTNKMLTNKLLIVPLGLKVIGDFARKVVDLREGVSE